MYVAIFKTNLCCNALLFRQGKFIFIYSLKFFLVLHKNQHLCMKKQTISKLAIKKTTVSNLRKIKGGIDPVDATNDASCVDSCYLRSCDGSCWKCVVEQ
jgi:hypothetical protein